ncbi:MAG: AMP-dependent synthetase/ligase [Rhizobiaceae bacterium]
MFPIPLEKNTNTVCCAAQTIPGLFRQRVAHSPSKIAYTEFDDTQEQWVNYTWTQMAQRVRQFQSTLQEITLDRGDRVAVWLRNGTNWVAVDIAVMSAGFVSVPLYIHDGVGSISDIVVNSGARLCVVDSRERQQELMSHPNFPTHSCHVWLLGKPNIALARSNRNQPDVLASCILQPTKSVAGSAPCRPHDLATLIYTSGTTGRPKGVMLSHAAILWNIEAVSKLIPPLESDVFLSILPLAHSFERAVGYYLPMMAGSRVAYARSAETLREDFKTVRPTALLAVPRLYERIHSTILHQAIHNPLKSAIISETARIGWALQQSRHHRVPLPGVFSRLIWPLLKFFVARRVMAVFGGRLRIAVSGGAALPTNVASFLVGMGLPLVEGYGLTEAGPVVTATTVRESLPGSVGRALEGLEIKIDKKNELLVRSPSLMLGYWGDSKKSSETVNASGWLKTGDFGHVEDQRLYIDGRLKELLVLSTGKKVSPAQIESAILLDPQFEQVCVIGNGRPCLAAIATLNDEIWQSLAADNNLDPLKPNAHGAMKILLERLNGLTSEMPRYGIVRAIHLTLDPWTIHNGLLTPTLKIKRSEIERRFSNEISALYEQLGRSARQTSSPAQVRQMRPITD